VICGVGSEEDEGYGQVVTCFKCTKNIDGIYTSLVFYVFSSLIYCCVGSIKNLLSEVILRKAF